MQDTRTDIEAILRDRIAVLDGSWGVLIQRQVRGEEAYRGERFRDHPHDVAGNPDLLNLTRPDDRRADPRRYFEAGADIIETNTFTATPIAQADYGLEDVVHELNVEAARLARRAADEWTRRTPDRPRFVAGAIGPLNVSALDLAARERPGVSGRSRSTSCATRTRDQVRGADRRRRRPAPGRDHLRHAERKAAIAAVLDAARELPLWLSVHRSTAAAARSPARR